MSLDSHLQYVAKFAGVGFHTALVRVTGYNFASIIYGPNNFANNVRTHLLANGIGVDSVTVEAATNQLTGYYSLLISINAQDGDSNERIRSLVFQSTTGDLSSLTVDVISNATIPTNTQETGAGWLDTILGNYPGVKDATETTKIAGLSLTTVALVGVGLVVILATRK